MRPKEIRFLLLSETTSISLFSLRESFYRESLKSQKIPWKEIPEQAPEVLFKYTLCLYDHTQFGVNVDDMFRKGIFGGAVRDLTLISQSRVELLKIKAYPLLNEKRRKNWRLWSLKSMQRKRNREVDYRYNIISRALYIRMGNSHRVTFQLHGN